MDDKLEGMSSNELELVGLSNPERVIYEALIEHGSATTAELRAMARGNARGLPGILKALEAKGLITRVAGRPVRYTPVPPEVGLELLLTRREEQLRRARSAALDLADRFHQSRARRDLSGLLEIVSGRRAVAERYSAIHRTAREQLRVMSRPPWVIPDEETRAISNEAHGKHMRLRNLIDPTYFEDGAEASLASIREDVAAGEEYRVITSVPLKLIVADDRAALIPLEIGPKGIESVGVFHASALLEAIVEVFETCWQLATPLDVVGVGQEGWPAESVSSEERELLALLSAGVLDKGIARQLDLSHTTVQRRINALKSRLGAATRFQAGVQAALRGWITDPGAPESLARSSSTETTRP